MKYGIETQLDATTRAVSGGFYVALQRKLYEAQKKYGWTDDWLRADADALRDELVRHIEKGDPLDVAAYCMFLWARQEATSKQQEPANEH